MVFRGVVVAVLLGALSGSVRADGLIYAYEGDILPYNPPADWLIFNPCESPCSESVEEDRFVLRWPFANDRYNYHYWISYPPETPPPTLWAEWQFRSNHPLGPTSYTCDGKFTVDYRGMHQLVFMYGDTAISHSGNDVVNFLDIDEFHTYRFESLDGINYTIAVDGEVFIVDAENREISSSYLQFGGSGGCLGDEIPNMINEWDFVRYGTISYGEQIVSTNPPTGYLSPSTYAELDRFTITFDSPNYIYQSEIQVSVSGGVAPAVVATKRNGTDGPETVEIRLSGPMPLGETTTFTIDDGQAVHVIEYTMDYDPALIPATSTWGLAALTLLILIAATHGCGNGTRFWDLSSVVTLPIVGGDTGRWTSPTRGDATFKTALSRSSTGCQASSLTAQARNPLGTGITWTVPKPTDSSTSRTSRLR